MKKKLRVLVVLLLFLLPIKVTFHPQKSSNTAERIFLTPSNDEMHIIEGTVTYTSEYCWEMGPSQNAKEVNFRLKYSYEKKVVLTLPEIDVIHFYKEYKFIPDMIYQKKNGSYYYPDYIELDFYDYLDTYLGTYSILEFNVNTNVDAETGQRMFYIGPYNAYYLKFYATFENYELYDIYYGLYSTIILGNNSSYSEIYVPIVKSWSEGTHPHPDFTVTGYGTYQGFETVIAEEDFPIGYGYTYYRNLWEYERYTGILVRCDYRKEKDDYLFSDLMEIDDIGKIVDDGKPIVHGPIYIEVEKLNPITLSYNATDINYDHYNFYKDGNLIETNTVWKEQFNFEITPTEGNTTYTFEAVDRLGNTASISTLVSFIDQAPGFTISLIILTTIYIVIVRKLTIRNGK